MIESWCGRANDLIEIGSWSTVDLPLRTRGNLWAWYFNSRVGIWLMACLDCERTLQRNEWLANLDVCNELMRFSQDFYGIDAECRSKSEAWIVWITFLACYGARFLLFNSSVIYSQFGIARIMEISQLGSATFTLSFKQTFNGKESLSVACVHTLGKLFLIDSSLDGRKWPSREMNDEWWWAVEETKLSAQAYQLSISFLFPALFRWSFEWNRNWLTSHYGRSNVWFIRRRPRSLFRSRIY